MAETGDGRREDAMCNWTRKDGGKKRSLGKEGVEAYQDKDKMRSQWFILFERDHKLKEGRKIRSTMQKKTIEGEEGAKGVKLGKTRYGEEEGE